MAGTRPLQIGSASRLMELPVAVAGASVEDSVCIMRSPGCSASRGSAFDRGGSTRPPPENQKIDAAWHFINASQPVERHVTTTGWVDHCQRLLTDAQLEQIRTTLSQRQSAPIMGQIGLPSRRGTDKSPYGSMRRITLPFFARSLCKSDGTIPLFETPIPKTLGNSDPTTQVADGANHQPYRFRVTTSWVSASWAPSLSPQRRAHIIERSNLLLPKLDHSRRRLGRVIRASSSITRTRADGRYSPFWLALLGCLCATSDKGSTRNACQKFGGLAPLAQFLDLRWANCSRLPSSIKATRDGDI